MRRLRNDEGGFGLVELVIAMAILNIGLLALVAAFNSGAIAARRSGRVSTATALADRQMELYRALPYGSIWLNSNPVSSPYNDAASRPAGAVVLGCGAPPPAECTPIQAVTGPDGRSYRIDTYVVTTTPTGNPAPRPVKLVRVIVRDGATPATVYARLESTFDEANATAPTH
jgi:type II secretory pathway pseudopilin PulG